MLEGLSIHPSHCQITLNIPWAVAKALTEDGPSIISALKLALTQQEQENKHVQNLKQYHDQHQENELDRWQRLARHADRMIRQSKRGGASASKALSEAAKHFDVPFSSLQAIVLNYRKERRNKIAARRNAQIIRGYFRGYSNKEIAKKTGTSPRNVSRALSHNQDLISQLRLYERRRLFRPKSQSTKHSSEEPNKAEAQNSAAQDSVAERRQFHKKLGIQFYRIYRRKVFAAAADRLTLFKELSSGQDFHHSYAERLISERRKQVARYIETRRFRTALRLKSKGRTNQQIAERLKLHPKTAQKITKKALALTNEEAPKRLGLHPLSSRALLRKARNAKPKRPLTAKQRTAAAQALRLKRRTENHG